MCDGIGIILFLSHNDFLLYWWPIFFCFHDSLKVPILTERTTIENNATFGLPPFAFFSNECSFPFTLLDIWTLLLNYSRPQRLDLSMEVSTASSVG